MKKRTSKLRFGIVISVMVLLIVIGIVLTVRMYNNYSALILKNTDNQLISLARSVDLSAENKLERIADNFIHTMEYKKYKVVEKMKESILRLTGIRKMKRDMQY